MITLIANNLQEAMIEVKERLGSSASIVSWRNLGDKIEVTATSSEAKAQGIEGGRDGFAQKGLSPRYDVFAHEEELAQKQKTARETALLKQAQKLKANQVQKPKIAKPSAIENLVKQKVQTPKVQISEGLKTNTKVHELVGILAKSGLSLKEIKPFAKYLGQKLYIAKEPMTNLRLFANPVFLNAALVGYVATVALFGAEFLMPVYLQAFRGRTALQTGFILLGVALTSGIDTPLAGRLYDKIGPRMNLVVGFSILIINTWQLSKIQGDTSVSYIFFLLALRGLAVGLTLQTSFVAALSSMPLNLLPRGSSLLNSTRFVVQAVSVAALATVFSSAVPAEIRAQQDKLQETQATSTSAVHFGVCETPGVKAEDNLPPGVDASLASLKAGNEQYCEVGMAGTYNGYEMDRKTPTYGGYSNSIVVDENYTLHVSDKLPLKAVAPLLCAGITTYSPLRHWKIGKGQKVAIVGLGGLGHMGVKFAVSFGAEVTVLSHSASKETDDKRLGAHHFVNTKDEKAVAKVRNHFDFILDTVSAQHDLNMYLGMLKTEGTLVMVGVPPEAVPVHAFSLIPKRKTLAGSMIGGIRETQEMLDYCAANNIVSDIELINIKDIEQAYARMVKGDVRYRFVIDMATL